MHRFIKARLFASALLAPVGASAADDSHTRAAVEGTILPLMSRHDIPGLAVALTVDGRAYAFNFGVTAKQDGTPVTDSTLFEIGSVTKTMTATLAAYAQSTGKLSLDDHPGKYLPALKGTAVDKATVLHLATYTAGGLPLQFPDAVEGDAATWAYFRDWKPTARPGSLRSYSNPSLGLLGAVVAKALDQDFATALETRLFPAFGMAHSHVRVPERAMQDYAWGHRDGKQVRMQPGPLAEPTYGVRTTASDLLRFVQMNIDPSSLEPAMRRAVEATQVGHFRSGPLVQGLGWEQYPYPVSREWLLGGNSAEMLLDPQPAYRLPDATQAGPRLFNKTGSTGGFGAYVAFVPSKRVGIVMLANRNYPIPARVEAACAILQALAPTSD
ncbi:class C beta-lactamase [Roseateles sp. NT4]|uniref:class C beta-lactamase n=1 Tax=Roseateles sp. NT4 TaxID=3453715 RepID=UPI003EEAC7EF